MHIRSLRNFCRRPTHVEPAASCGIPYWSSVRMFCPPEYLQRHAKIIQIMIFTALIRLQEVLGVCQKPCKVQLLQHFTLLTIFSVILSYSTLIINLNTLLPNILYSTYVDTASKAPLQFMPVLSWMLLSAPIGSKESRSLWISSCQRATADCILLVKPPESQPAVAPHIH